MPFVPFAAAAGTALGTSAAVGGAVVAGSALAAGSSIANSVAQSKQKKSISSQIGSFMSEVEASKQNVKDAQASASTSAVETLRRKTSGMSKTIYTNPLGIGGQASVARKTLLGQ